MKIVQSKVSWTYTYTIIAEQEKILQLLFVQMHHCIIQNVRESVFLHIFSFIDNVKANRLFLFERELCSKVLKEALVVVVVVILLGGV